MFSVPNLRARLAALAADPAPPRSRHIVVTPSQLYAAAESPEAWGAFCAVVRRRFEAAR